MKYKDYLKGVTRCPFCYLDKNQIIKENGNAFLTFCLAPYHKHHMLVIPKKHTEKIFDIEKDELKGVYELLQIGTNILKNIGYDNLTLLVREGDGAGKSIPHMHFHIIPNTRIGDVDSRGEERNILSDEEIIDVVSEFKSAL